MDVFWTNCTKNEWIRLLCLYLTAPPNGRSAVHTQWASGGGILIRPSGEVTRSNLLNQLTQKSKVGVSLWLFKNFQDSSCCYFPQLRHYILAKIVMVVTSSLIVKNTYRKTKLIPLSPNDALTWNFQSAQEPEKLLTRIEMWDSLSHCFKLTGSVSMTYRQV